jgi:two-component system sensor histidine kinase HydH
VLKSYLRQLTLVKRYLLVSLSLAVIPLVIIVALYDSHNATLANRLLLEKTEGEIEATVVKLENFIDIQIKRLNNLTDLQEVDSVFSKKYKRFVFPEQLLDFLYFETSDADIYSIEFYDVDGHFLSSLPKSNELDNFLRVKGTTVDSVIISDPVLPTPGKPGWFHFHKQVIRKNETIGTIALKVRLASLTEKTASLYRAGIYEPVIYTPNQESLSSVGTLINSEVLLINSESFIPGWLIGLKQKGQPVLETGVRHWLLLLVLVLAISIFALFFNMSKRLASWVVPLKDGAKAIARGDLNVKVPDNGPGELGMLARSFNDMSDQLSSMISSRVDVERRAALGNLATGIAHEIRNPLATIGTTIHGLIGTEKDPERKKMLEAVDNEIIRTDSIVEEFMNYAHPREPKLEAVSISDVFNHVKVLVSATALESRVEIRLLGQRSVMVFADPGQLRQVFMNIIFNALQAMPDGGHLRLRVVAKGDVAEISVSDTGVGIDPDTLAKVQQPFFTTKKGGTGLGLSICVQLIKVNNATFNIDSELGVGTTISINLPLLNNNNSHGINI